MKKVISLLLLIVFICSTVTFAHPFTDVSGHWAEAEIEKGFESKAINGDPDGRFRPDDSVTRAEFLKMLISTICNRFEINITDEFGSDIHWASKYYNFAKTYVYIEIDDLEIDGTKPGVMTTAEDYDKNISRWEMAFMLSSVLENIFGLDKTAEAPPEFSDIEDVNKYSERISKSIINCNEYSLMKGDENNVFSPAANGTRAEAITVINRIDTLIQKLLAEYEAEQAAIEEAYNKKIAESLVTYEKIPTGHPVATILMENNKKIVMELYPEYAPQTVANFVKLTKDGFYNGLTFDRIVADFVAQGGAPATADAEASLKNIKGEFASNGFEKNTLSHTRGVVSMARSQHPDSANSQFFICYDDASFLDGQYAAFGKVIKGMEVVDAFTEVELQMNELGEMAAPKKPIKIKSITIK